VKKLGGNMALEVILLQPVPVSDHAGACFSGTPGLNNTVCKRDQQGISVVSALCMAFLTPA
jgi:hypothetical protein